MKIGILYICTGKYDSFFKDFYNSMEENFLPGDKKTYYVWTDSKSDDFDHEDIELFYQEKLGWPYDTMMRFAMFNEHRESLAREDYLFFLNANMVVKQKIDNEILNNGLIGVRHPGLYSTPKENLPYERNPFSSVYLSKIEGGDYCQGCFNGGRTKDFLEMSDILDDEIRKDLEKGIIPIWHDESALNWYFEKIKKPKILDPGYAYPEAWSIPFEQKIIQLDKSSRGGHEYLRS